MNKRFQPFQYQLNLNTGCEKSPGKIKRENLQKTISVLITPQTNIYHAAKKLCIDNNLNENLVLILAASISEQVEKQIKQAQRFDTYGSVSSNFSQQSKKKSFKNRFCQSLQDSQCSIADNESTFRNTEFVIDPSTVNNSDEDEYSFRPATYMKMLDMTDNDEENQSISSVNDFSVNQSYLTTDSTNSKQVGKISTKNNFSKKEMNVFDNLYQHSKALEWKKNLQRKKSLQKITFKPKLNLMSKKILQNKQQQANLQVLTQKSPKKQISPKKSPVFLNKSKSKSTLEATRVSRNNSIKFQSQKQNQLSIYERGMIYRKVSQQKLLKMKERQIIDEIKSCTFKPKLNPRENSKNSKPMSTSFRRLI